MLSLSKYGGRGAHALFAFEVAKGVDAVARYLKDEGIAAYLVEIGGEVQAHSTSTRLSPVLIR